MLLLAGAGSGVAVWQLASNSGASSDTSAPRPSEPLAQAGTPMPAEGSGPTEAATEVDPTSEAPARDAVQQSAAARLVLAAARGDSWLSVRVGSASGELLYEGLLTQGNSLSFKRKRLWIRMGAPQSLDATLNGTTVSSLPAGTADIIVTAAGVRTVSVG